jgi:ActR/RegA family two-component response regulator
MARTHHHLQRRAAQARGLALAQLCALSERDVNLARVVADHIARVLDAADGNLSLAAELLGVNRRTMQRYKRRQRSRSRARRGRYS